MPPARRPSNRLIAGIIGGAASFVGGPTLGVVVTAFFVQRAFAAVATADPSEKARLLAEGISEAMNFAIAGLVVGFVGMAVFAVSLFFLLRQRAP
jgi:biopolymer transport protein ExbB/TolQ